ncbi:MAG: TerB family tellurite resistance protein [Bacteroidota bacterium]
MDLIAMDIVTKKQLNILIQLAEADKHFAKVEREMVFRIARERNFPEDAVNEIIRNPEPIGTLGALSNDQKFEYLIECIMLMFIDQKVFESEIIFCKSIAIKLGFMKNVVDFLSKNFSSHSREELKKTVLSEYMLT